MNIKPIKYIIEGEDITYIWGRMQRDKTIKWVVEEIGTVMNKYTGNFEPEPIPSEKTDEFKERTYFNSAEDALSAYEKFYPQE